MLMVCDSVAADSVVGRVLLSCAKPDSRGPPSHTEKIGHDDIDSCDVEVLR